MESSRCSRSLVACGESVAGLMPITASPQPRSSPSSTAAAIPRGSSVGWLGCSRVASVPRVPIVVRNAEDTCTAAATAIRSWLRMILLVAAAISGVRPGAIAAMRSALLSQQAVPESSHRQMRYRRKGLAVMAVEDQPGDFVGFVRNDLLFQEGVQRQVGDDPCGRGAFGVVLGCASGQLVT